MDGGEALSRVFRPEQFFVGRTEGWGVVRELGGRRRRCQIITEGHLDESYQALHFDETFTFDDGETQQWRWAMTRGRDGRYVAAEAMVGAGIVGRHDKRGDYVLNFRRPLRPEGGFPTPSYNTRFTLTSANSALKRVRIGVLGLTVATMTAVHERV
ncbi:MAG TPA: DUF3833 family protein [Caulobacteraceae bacterium]